MTYQQLLEKLTELNKTQPELMNQEINLVTDTTVPLELSYGMATEQLFFVTFFNWGEDEDA